VVCVLLGSFHVLEFGGIVEHRFSCWRRETTNTTFTVAFFMDAVFSRLL
jgi:hypothetical protein